MNNKEVLEIRMEHIIYKILCDDLDVKYTYVGSTKDFTTRKHKHKPNSNSEKRHGIQCYKMENWSMVKIETCICETTLNARIREQYYH